MDCQAPRSGEVSEKMCSRPIVMAPSTVDGKKMVIPEASWSRSPAWGLTTPFRVRWPRISAVAQSMVTKGASDVRVGMVKERQNKEQVTERFQPRSDACCSEVTAVIQG